MALGEYVSVSSQRDSQQLIEKERAERLQLQSRAAELTAISPSKGLTAETAHQVALELTSDPGCPAVRRN